VAPIGDFRASVPENAKKNGHFNLSYVKFERPQKFESQNIVYIVTCVRFPWQRNVSTVT
jgi:hypothetical protein